MANPVKEKTDGFHVSDGIAIRVPKHLRESRSVAVDFHLTVTVNLTKGCTLPLHAVRASSETSLSPGQRLHTALDWDMRKPIKEEREGFHVSELQLSTCANRGWFRSTFMRDTVPRKEAA